MYRPAISWFRPSVYLTALLFIFAFKKLNRRDHILSVNRLSAKIMLCVLILFGYLCCVGIVQNGDFGFINSLAQLIVSFGVVCLVFDYYKDYVRTQCLKIIVNTCLFQSAICVLMIIFPSLHDLYSSVAVRESNIVATFSIVRSYGIAGATEYPFGIGLVHGLVALMYVSEYWGKLDIKSVLKVLFLLIPCVVDTKMGLICFCTCVIILMFSGERKSFKLFYNNALRLVYLALVVYIASLFLEKYMPEYYSWLCVAIDAIWALITNDQSIKAYDWYGGLLPINWNTPTGCDVLFGKGKVVLAQERIFGGEYDSGMYRMIWYGGLIYIIVTFTMLYLMLYSVKTRDVNGNCVNIGTLFFVFIFLSNMKGDAVMQSSFMGILVFLTLYYRGIRLRT